MGVSQGRKVVGILIAAFAIAVPAMLRSGFFGSKVGSLTMLLPIAAAGGALGAVIMSELRLWYAAVVGGAVPASARCS